MPDISTVIPNVLLLLIVAGFVQWLKSTGRITSADAPGASAICGLVLGVLLGLAGGHGPRQLVYDGIFGLALGFGATGTYAVASKIGGGSGSPPIPPSRRVP